MGETEQALREEIIKAVEIMDVAKLEALLVAITHLQGSKEGEQ